MNLDQLVYDTAISEGYNPTVAKLIVAQARLESGNYSSHVFQSDNNMFGMKYVGQPLASRGTLAPVSEQTCGGKCNEDYYAKYASPADSVKDVVGRLFKITRDGIGFNEINTSTSPLDYAQKLKQRGYFGIAALTYAAGLEVELAKVAITDFVKKKAI